MYAHSKGYFYCPKASDKWDAEREVDEYAKSIAKGRDYTSFKVYGWKWKILIYV